MPAVPMQAGPGPDAGGPGGLGSAGPGRGTGGPSVGALITITAPHTALGGDDGPPGEVAGFGILDHADIRDLVTTAASNPATRWCLTTLHPDGTAAAHACAAGPRPWPPAPGPPGPAGQGPPGPVTLHSLMDFLGITHLVKARNTTCTVPGCGRRAARCD